MARGLKFCTKEEEVLCYPSSENKGADHSRNRRKFDECESRNAYGLLLLSSEKQAKLCII